MIKCAYCDKEAKQMILGSTWGDEIPVCRECKNKIKGTGDGTRY